MLNIFNEGGGKKKLEYLCHNLDDTYKEMISDILYKLYWRLTVNEWQIGFPQTTLENIAMGGNYKIALLKGAPKDRWFADPFILDVTPTHITLLVEEFVSASAKGRIARLIISRKDYTLERNDTLLDLDTHLSFPTIVRREDAVYIIPENSAGGKLNAYKYDEAVAKCLPYKTLSDEPLIDAIHHDIDGKEYIFATKGPDANGTTLHIYRKDEKGTYTQCQTVTFPDNIARNGGAFFSIGNTLYRPAQDCNGGYGRGLSIQKIEKDDKGLFTVTETVRLKSPRKRLDHGMHTLNEYKGITVVDLSSYRWPTISSIVDAIWKRFHLPVNLK